MSTIDPKVSVTITQDGPYLVAGNVKLVVQTIGVSSNGESEEWIEGKTFSTPPAYALCRCGESHQKPFCDGTHAVTRFDGSETASRESYQAQSQLFEGPVLSLTDAPPLCAFARFCDPAGQVWAQVTHTDKASVRQTFMRQVANCPAGRLVVRDNSTGEAIEPRLPVSIALIEDPARQCSGPLGLRGGIAVVGVDGFMYETRNRLTLCRCGHSQNKPLCDGSHAASSSGLATG